MKFQARFVAYALAIILLIGICITAITLLDEKTARDKIHPILLKEAQDKQKVNVIVGKRAGCTGVEEKAAELGAVITSNWKFINAFAATVPADKLYRLAAIPGVVFVNNDSSISHDSTLTWNPGAIINAYNEATGADKMWAKGYYGKDITIAVVDSGVSDEGALGGDLGARVIKREKIKTNVLYSADKYGHGTHVAGIIAGDGQLSNGKYVGIAPEANIISVKFSDDNGIANEKDLVDALQWVYENRANYNIRIVNISSTVSTPQKYTASATCAAAEQLWKAGVIVVVSAGNLGSQKYSTSYAPANDPFVITVGAIDDNGTKELGDDFMKSWSSCGNTMDGVMKPDIMAPGAHIVSYMPSGELRKQCDKNIVDTYYFKMGGTSMAAPMVSGVAALMLQVHPGWTPDQVKWVIMNTSRSYIDQTKNTVGIISADSAAFYPMMPRNANEGCKLSPLLDPTAAAKSYSNMSWSNMSWSNMSWSNMSWSNSFDK